MFSSLRSWIRASAQRLVNIPENVVERLKSDRHAHHVGRDAGLDLVGFAHLAMRGGGRMDDQRLGVADIREMAHELRRLDELLARTSRSPGRLSFDAEIQKPGGAFG